MNNTWHIDQILGVLNGYSTKRKYLVSFNPLNYLNPKKLGKTHLPYAKEARLALSLFANPEINDFEKVVHAVELLKTDLGKIRAIRFALTEFIFNFKPVPVTKTNQVGQLQTIIAVLENLKNERHRYGKHKISSSKRREIEARIIKLKLQIMQLQATAAPDAAPKVVPTAVKPASSASLPVSAAAASAVPTSSPGPSVPVSAEADTVNPASSEPTVAIQRHVVPPLELHRLPTSTGQDYVSVLPSVERSIDDDFTTSSTAPRRVVRSVLPGAADLQSGTPDRLLTPPTHRRVEAPVHVDIDSDTDTVSALVDPVVISDGDASADPAVHSDGDASVDPAVISDGDASADPAVISDGDASADPAVHSDGDASVDPAVISDGDASADPAVISDGVASVAPAVVDIADSSSDTPVLDVSGEDVIDTSSEQPSNQVSSGGPRTPVLTRARDSLVADGSSKESGLTDRQKFMIEVVRRERNNT